MVFFAVNKYKKIIWNLYAHYKSTASAVNHVGEGLSRYKINKLNVYQCHTDSDT